MKTDQGKPREILRPWSSVKGAAESGALAAIARRIDAKVQETLAKLSRHATEIAVAAAEALVGADARLSRSALEAALREATAALVGAVRIRIVVHPSQAEAVKQMTAELARHVQVDIETDEHLRPGGCIITSDLGEVDATIESRVRRLKEAIEEEIGF